jgi:hypothetical protein
MPTLPKPYEIYEWKDGATEEWTVERWELGDLTIEPRDGRPSKDIQVLRILVPAEQKDHYPPYWDLTSARLVAQLKGILSPSGLGPTTVRVTAIGAAPRTHFSVTRIPTTGA